MPHHVSCTSAMLAAIGRPVVNVITVYIHKPISFWIPDNKLMSNLTIFKWDAISGITGHHGLFYNAISISDYIVMYASMINE
jgi:hypothetical protein